MNNLVVIARFDENVDWVKKLNWDYLIYNKGEYIDKEYKSIPNIGREGETYLRYIIEFYDKFPDYISFVQGDPFPHCSNLINKINNAALDNQIINLADMIVSDNPDSTLMSHNVESLGLDYKEHLFTFPAGAQFIIPKSYITNKSLNWWKKCYDIYVSNHNNPWSFERLWPLIFNYENNI